MYLAKVINLAFYIKLISPNININLLLIHNLLGYQKGKKIGVFQVRFT